MRRGRQDEIGLEHSHFPQGSRCLAGERDLGLNLTCGERMGYNGRDLRGGIGCTWDPISASSSSSYMILSKLLNLLSFGFLLGKIGGNVTKQMVSTFGRGAVRIGNNAHEVPSPASHYW